MLTSCGGTDFQGCLGLSFRPDSLPLFGLRVGFVVICQNVPQGKVTEPKQINVCSALSFDTVHFSFSI